jgi:glycosyltransferase involved in cell wall biosynthesis
LLCISRIDYQKNQKLLVELTAQCRAANEDVHLLLIGPVSVPSYYDELKKLAADLGVSEFLTVVPGAEPGGELIRAAYQQSDVFLLPSLHEPFGIVALEAWSCGLPVIASRVGGLQHLVHDGEDGLLCDPRQLNDWVHALAALRQPSLREALVQGGNKSVSDYSWERISLRLLDFYREVLGA